MGRDAEVRDGEPAGHDGEVAVTPLPLGDATAQASQAPRLALEDRQVQVYDGIRREGLELLVPADRLREVVRAPPEQRRVEPTLPRGRAVDALVEIERAADDRRERALRLVDLLHARGAVVDPEHEDDEGAERERREDVRDPDMSPLWRGGNAIHGTSASLRAS